MPPYRRWVGKVASEINPGGLRPADINGFVAVRHTVPSAEQSMREVGFAKHSAYVDLSHYNGAINAELVAAVEFAIEGVTKEGSRERAIQMAHAHNQLSWLYHNQGNTRGAADSYSISRFQGIVAKLGGEDSPLLLAASVVGFFHGAIREPHVRVRHYTNRGGLKGIEKEVALLLRTTIASTWNLRIVSHSVPEMLKKSISLAMAVVGTT